MITCELAGGLGNNLFQFAAIYCLSKKYSAPYCIQSELERKTFDGKLLKYDNRIKQTHVYEIPRIFENNFSYLSLSEMRQKGFKPYNHTDLSGNSQYQELPLLENTIYKGYFQSDKYFNGIDLASEWKINKRIKQALSQKHSALFQKPTISIQYRLAGDRKLGRIPDLYKTVPPSYYREGVERILESQQKKLDDFNLLLFSDDLELAKQLVSETGLKVFPVDNDNSILDFVSMTMCDHNVIGNSTFAWWTAYMNDNKHKVVVAPKTFWFGKDSGYSHFNLDDLFPSSWVTL